MGSSFFYLEFYLISCYTLLPIRIISKEGFNIIRNDYDDFMRALDDYVDGEGPLPLPCATPECDGHMMDYDYTCGLYTCLICGREVGEQDAMKYLYSIRNDTVDK